MELELYEEILGVNMPEPGTYVSSYNRPLLSSCDNCFTLSTHFLEEGISTEGKNWLSYSELDKKLQLKFAEGQYKDSSYYMVYNEKTKEYNSVSTKNEKNLYYFISYNPEHKNLDIIAEEINFNE